MEEITGVQTKVLTENKIANNRFSTQDVEVVVPLLEEQTKCVKGAFELVKGNLGNLVFRRVKTPIAVPENYLYTSSTTPLENGGVETKFYKAGDVYSITPEEYKRNVAEHYKDFSMFTSEAKIRKENDRVRGEIYGHSKNYADFDLMDFTFHPTSRTMKPREGDLVCGAVEFDKKGNANYAYWFVCSEQFLRFWTLIMYDQHDSFRKVLEKNTKKENRTKSKKVDEDALRRKVLSGNHLMTGGYRKWLLSCDQTLISGRKIVSEPKELLERFWLHRTESASMYVHVYAALVLLFRYYELPCENNVPNNINNGPFMNKWDLPENWVRNFCITNGIYPQCYTKIVQVPVIGNEPPKGTKFAEPEPVLLSEESNSEKLGSEDEDGIFIPNQFDDE